MKGLDALAIIRSAQLLSRQLNLTASKSFKQVAAGTPYERDAKLHSRSASGLVCNTGNNAPGCPNTAVAGKRAPTMSSHAHLQTLMGKRCKHRLTEKSVDNYQVDLDDSRQCLEIREYPGDDENGTPMKIPYLWLRDHCRSERCFNHKTLQKIPDLELPSRDLTPQGLDADHDGLTITWRDGHVTRFSFDWLVENFRSSRRSRAQLWDQEKITTQPLPVVTFEEHMTSEEGLKRSLNNLVQYGFTLISDSPPTAEGTRQASERVSPIQESMYGGLWTVSPTMGNNDTAYTHDSLGAHTDNTYLTSPAGIEVFHILEHDGTGGETLLVDGFSCVDTLRREDQAAWTLLRDTAIPFEYVATAADGKPPYVMKTYSPIFTVHPVTGDYLTFRFNAYDRGVIDTVLPERMAQFYAAYHRLHNIISKPESELRFKLSPGTVLLVDNWRVMHGRSAFTGYRLLSGCYLSRDEWLSQARMYGAL